MIYLIGTEQESSVCVQLWDDYSLACSGSAHLLQQPPLQIDTFMLGEKREKKSICWFSLPQRRAENVSSDSRSHRTGHLPRSCSAALLRPEQGSEPGSDPGATTTGRDEGSWPQDTLNHDTLAMTLIHMTVKRSLQL